MSEFYMIIAGEIFFPIFFLGGGAHAPAPRLLRLWLVFNVMIVPVLIIGKKLIPFYSKFLVVLMFSPITTTVAGHLNYCMAYFVS